MTDLIEALQIFLKYSDVRCPTFCNLGALYIIEVGKVSDPDHRRLEELGFKWHEIEEVWYSNRFGS